MSHDDFFFSKKKMSLDDSDLPHPYSWLGLLYLGVFN